MYEKFILEYYRTHYPKLNANPSYIDWNVPNDTSGIEFLPVMQSDITLTNGDKTLIIDAKFYSHSMQTHFDKNSYISHNLYQIYTYPLSKAGSFWINIPLIYLLMPLSAILAHYFGIKWGLWCAYFSCLNALAHVVMFLKFNRKYNPGLVVSVLFNIPIGIYTVWYFLSNNLVSTKINILSIIIGILAQASMMVYGFWLLVLRFGIFCRSFLLYVYTFRFPYIA